MVPASVKAGRRRVSAAEACLRSCGLMRLRGEDSVEQVGSRLPLSRVPQASFDRAWVAALVSHIENLNSQ